MFHHLDSNVQNVSALPSDVVPAGGRLTYKPLCAPTSPAVIVWYHRPDTLISLDFDSIEKIFLEFSEQSYWLDAYFHCARFL